MSENNKKETVPELSFGESGLTNLNGLDMEQKKYVKSISLESTSTVLNDLKQIGYPKEAIKIVERKEGKKNNDSLTLQVIM